MDDGKDRLLGGPAARLVAGLTLPVRATLFLIVFAATLGGAYLYKPFQQNLAMGVEPPATSLSGIAKREYNKLFSVDPLQLTARLRSADGSPLILDAPADPSASTDPPHGGAKIVAPRRARPGRPLILVESERGDPSIDLSASK